MHARVNKGERTTRRRVSRRGQSDAVEGEITTSKGGGRERRNERDK
jgi:hypothetical protein